jgi:uncharacterized protein (DUF1800 family)
MVSFIEIPALHDNGFKTILGKRAQFDADKVFDLLVSQPQHARFLMKKMWEWFAYPRPEDALVEKLASVYRSNEYELKPVLRWIATSPEFWSDKAQRAIVKSPIAYSVAIGRQLELGTVLAKTSNASPSRMQPVPNALRDAGNLFAYLTRKQGLALLFPPDVSGWHWGPNWISTDAMIERVKAADYFFRQRQNQIVPTVATRIKEKYNPKTSAEFVDAIAKWFDVPLDEGQKALLVKACDANGGVGALAKTPTAGKLMSSVFKLVAAVPEFQMC